MRVIGEQTTPIIMFLLVASTDHITPITGLGSAPVVTLSKNGGAFAAATNTVIEVGNGWYKVTLAGLETYLAGIVGWDLVLHATGVGADPTDRMFTVETASISSVNLVAVLSYTALTNINGVLPTLLTNTDSRLDNLDAAVSSRLPTSGYTAPPATVTLAASQPNYAPAKVGDAMNLTIAYNAAKTAAPTTGMIDSALTAMHGSGSWVSTSAPTTAQINSALSASHGSGSWQSGGSGSILTNVYVSDDTDAPLDGVACWITTDPGGVVMVAGVNYTDALGYAQFLLDTGTYCLWRQRSGINFSNPTIISV